MAYTYNPTSVLERQGEEDQESEARLGYREPSLKWITNKRGGGPGAGGVALPSRPHSHQHTTVHGRDPYTCQFPLFTPIWWGRKCVTLSVTQSSLLLQTVAKESLNATESHLSTWVSVFFVILRAGQECEEVSWFLMNIPNWVGIFNYKIWFNYTYNAISLNFSKMFLMSQSIRL